MPKFGYITILSGDTHSFLGTLILAVSLIKSKTKHDLILLHTFGKSVPEYKLDILSKYFTIVKGIKKASLSELFKFKEYDKLIHLSNDVIINKNIDNLFISKNNKVNNKLNNKVNNKLNNKVKLPCTRINSEGDVDSSVMIYNPNDKITGETVFTNLPKKYNYYVGVDSNNSNSLSNIYVINYENVVSPWVYVTDLKRMKEDPELKKNYIYYQKWIDIFKKEFKNYRDNYDINIIYPDKQLIDINNYLKRKYKNLKYIKMTRAQQNKLNDKLNTPILYSNRIPSRNFTYRYIINKIGSDIFIGGGVVRNIFNDEDINDVDIFYTIPPDEMEKKLKNIGGLIYYRSPKFRHFFRVGKIDHQEFDMSYINRIDTKKNSMSNGLIIDLDKMTVIDIYGEGAQNATKKVWRKPNNISTKKWLKQGGIANVLLGRMIKFIMMGYETIPKERAMIYNEWYYNKEKDDYGNLIKKKGFFKKDTDKKLDYIRDDVNSLKLDFTGDDMVNKIKDVINEEEFD